MGKKPPPPEPEEQFSCEMHSAKFFALCAAGGASACGLTHALVTPLDLVKCRLQVDPGKYKSIFKGFGISYREGGYPNLVKGWAPTLLGYSLQGAVKFSGYEYFKYKYSAIVGEETAFLRRTYIFLAASATAELIADVFLAPWEAIKVRMQTTPCFTSQVQLAMAHMLRTEGIGVFYRGLPPLWGRQVPYTMMKFSSFERVLEYLYDNVGLFGIWRGLVARIIMIGTLTGLQWFVYDGFKVYTGMPRPPPAEMPESLKEPKQK